MLCLFRCVCFAFALGFALVIVSLPVVCTWLNKVAPYGLGDGGLGPSAIDFSGILLGLLCLILAGLSVAAGCLHDSQLK